MISVDYFNVSGEQVFDRIEDTYGCIREAYTPFLWLENRRILEFSKSHSRFVVLGIGGSSLGGQAIKCAFNDESVKFLDNICPDSFFREVNKSIAENAGFIVISKSGETIETLAQLETVLPKFDNDEISKHFLVITEDKDSTLRNIGRKFDMAFIEHPKDVGGRFSVFSAVGMFPAYLMGLNVHKFKEGAKAAINQGYDVRIANFLEKPNHVFMNYSSKLQKFKEWIAQIYAESTGKDGKGITPLLPTGTTDQHSQLQLYLGGPKDKSFTFFIETGIECEEFSKSCQVKVLESKSLNDLFLAEGFATLATIEMTGSPVRAFKFDYLTEYELGYFFMYFMIEVIACCQKYLKVAPFDQPHVEIGKKLAIERLTKI